MNVPLGIFLRYSVVAVVCVGLGYWAGSHRHSPERFQFVPGDAIDRAFDRQTGVTCKPVRDDSASSCLRLYEGKR